MGRGRHKRRRTATGIGQVSLVACAVFALASTAAADEGRKALKVAQKYVELGEDLFRLEKYKEAADNFRRAEKTLEEADRDVPAPLFRQLARCHDQLLEAERAVAYYDKFLALAEEVKRPSAKLKRAIKEAREAATRLRGLLERTAIDFQVKPEGVEVRLDGRRVGTTPFEPVHAKPGPHTVVLTKEGHAPVELEVEVVAGAKVPVVASLAVAVKPAPAAGEEVTDEAEAAQEAEESPEEAPEPAAPQASEGGSALPIVLAVAAVGLAGGAVAMTLSAISEEEEADELVKNPGSDEEAAQKQVDDAYASAGLKRNLGLTLGVGALAAGAAAAWMIMASDASTGGAPDWLLAPTPGGATLLLTY